MHALFCLLLLLNVVERVDVGGWRDDSHTYMSSTTVAIVVVASRSPVRKMSSRAEGAG